MINVSQAFQDAWLNGKQKYIQLDFSDNTTLDDNSIVSESFSIRQALCEESQFAFGLTSSTEVSIKIFNNNKQYKGLYMSILVGAVDDEENYYTMDLGTYKIENDVRSDDRLYRTLTAYDALYNVLNNDYSGWYNNLGSTFTLKQFRDSFFTHIGITQESFTLIQDNVTLNKKPNVSSLSGKDIIQGICETSAAFGFINYDGKFQYMMPTASQGLYPADDLYPASNLYPVGGGSITADFVIDTTDDEAAPVMGGLIYSDYYTHRITGAKFQNSENTEEASSGTTVNQYQFVDSILYYNQTVSALQSIANTFINTAELFFYIPSSVKTRARVWVQPGDVVTVSTDDSSIQFPILERSMSGITALYDTYSAKGTEYYTYSPNTYSRKILETEVRVSETEETVEELDDDINNPTYGVKASIEMLDDALIAEVRRATAKETEIYSNVTMTADEISAEVVRAQGEESRLSSRISITSEEIRSEVSRAQGVEATMQSSITQTASQIAFKVSQGDVSSSLSMEAGQITLQSGRLVISTGNFTLDSSGNATATNFIAKEAMELYSATDDSHVFLHAINSDQIMVTTDGRNLLPLDDSNLAGWVCGDINSSGTLNIDEINCSSLSAGLTIEANQIFSTGGRIESETSVIAGTHVSMRSPETTTNASNIHCTSEYGVLKKVTSSSRRWKNSITTDIDESMNPHRLYDLPVCQFKYNTDYLADMTDERYNAPVVGFIAEDLDAIYPIACDYDDYHFPADWSYRFIVPPMLKLIQEQHIEIETLKSRVAELEENYVS